jgi:hypothetical protein
LLWEARYQKLLLCSGGKMGIYARVYINDRYHIPRRSAELVSTMVTGHI